MKTRNATQNTTKSATSTGNLAADTTIVEEDGVFDKNETSPPQSITLDILTEQLKILRSDIAEDFSKHKDEIISRLQEENNYLKSELEKVKNELKKKGEDLVEVERDVIDLQQYVRRNNIEICGIPETVENKNLEKTVVEIAEVIGVDIKRNDIEACHRLAKRKNEAGPKRTIIRFVNRKNCESLLRNKKKLNNDETKNKLRRIGISNRLFINSNLSPYNKFLWGKCKHLHDEGMIDRFWVYNGSLHIAEYDGDEGLKIGHVNDLEKLFPNLEFTSSNKSDA